MQMQVRRDQVSDDAVPQVETPFLQVTLEDSEKFGVPNEPLPSLGQTAGARGSGNGPHHCRRRTGTERKREIYSHTRNGGSNCRGKSGSGGGDRSHSYAAAADRARKAAADSAGEAARGEERWRVESGAGTDSISSSTERNGCARL